MATLPAEPDIIVNGVKLNDAQAMTVRVALIGFLTELQNPDTLGKDKHGRSMVELYKTTGSEVQNIMLNNLAEGLRPPEIIPFSTKELAQEVLKRLNQDVPNTTVASLKIILERFVGTGKYLDEIGVLLGEQPTPPLAVQRFAAE